jgi:hypothetical protein
MRFSEFIAVPENTSGEDAFKSLMMLLRQSANDEKEGSTISWDAISTYMNNIGHTMDYNTFKAMYDEKPELKALVSDYDENGVTINTTADAPQQDEPVDIPPDQVVGKMAKRAMNKRDM